MKHGSTRAKARDKHINEGFQQRVQVELALENPASLTAERISIYKKPPPPHMHAHTKQQPHSHTHTHTETHTHTHTYAGMRMHPPTQPLHRTWSLEFLKTTPSLPATENLTPIRSQGFSKTIHHPGLLKCCTPFGNPQSILHRSSLLYLHLKMNIWLEP